MNAELIYGFLPLIVLGFFPVLMLLVVSFFRNYRLIFGIAIAAMVATAVLLFLPGKDVYSAGSFLLMDSYSRFYIGLISVAGSLVTLFSFKYFSGDENQQEEYYILLVTAVFGSAVMAASSHLLSLFLGLEVLSISLYTLIAYKREKSIAIEGGVKYLVLAAASSAFMLMGIALVYFTTGSMSFAEIVENIGKLNSLTGIAGLGMFGVGAGFKLALVPFHLWTPDVYQGAPAPVTALIASVSKGGMFAAFLRFFSNVNYTDFGSLVIVFVVIAVFSMLGGNILALLQKNVKRMLAYSSIGHLGYLLIAFLSIPAYGAQAGTFYITAYVFTILGAFGIVSFMSGPSGESEDIADYKGLFWRRPWLALAFTATLLSLAGIPLTIGFMGKYYLLMVGIERGFWLLALTLVISSVIGLFYYLRVIVAMLSTTDDPVLPKPESSFTNSFAVFSVTVIVIWFGLFPGLLMDLIRVMIP